MAYASPERALLTQANVARTTMFGFPNILRFWKSASADSEPAGARATEAKEDAKARSLFPQWRWPLAARVPVVSGALIFSVAIVISRVMMSSIAHEQELGVRQIAAVYLDGIATTIYPHVVARNLANTTEALRRTMWFHQGMREQRAIVRLPDGSVFADEFGPNDNVGNDDPLHDALLQRQLEQGDGFVFDAHNGTGWASRAIVRNGEHVADLYVAVELKALIAEREALRRRLLPITVLAGFAAAAIGFLIVRRMVLPVRLLTERLRRAQAGDFEPVSLESLPPASSEYGRLLRGYNGLIRAIGEREQLATTLAQRERESVLGRLAATVAHEVRNPLGGMSTALNTVRKYGTDPDIRAKSLDLMERGLWTIGDVVSSVLEFHRMPPDGRQLTSGDLEDLRVLIEPEAARRHLQLTWDCSVPETIDVAATETRQIALNLLLNACEASPQDGEVGFRAWVTNSDVRAERTELVLQVLDCGPGLPDAIAAALMEGGVRDPHAPPRGLGIRVVRDLVRGLRGRIVAKVTKADRGSCITVTLPLGARAEQRVAT
jgi:two-component system, OmpR family, sensor kinase